VLRERFARMTLPSRVLAGAVFVWALLSNAASGPPARAAGIEEGEDAVLLDESYDIEIVSESLARVHYFNTTKVLTPRGVEENRVASVFYNPSVIIRDRSAAVTSPAGKRPDVKKQQIFDRAAFD